MRWASSADRSRASLATFGQGRGASVIAQILLLVRAGVYVAQDRADDHRRAGAEESQVDLPDRDGREEPERSEREAHAQGHRQGGVAFEIVLAFPTGHQYVVTNSQAEQGQVEQG